MDMGISRCNHFRVEISNVGLYELDEGIANEIHS